MIKQEIIINMESTNIKSTNIKLTNIKLIDCELDGLDEDFYVVIDVPNNFNKWNHERKVKYLENNISRIEKKKKKNIHINLAMYHDPVK